MTRRPTFAAIGAFVCIAVVASFVFFAVTADGRPGSESTSNDGGAWLVNRRIGSVGHMNRLVKEVSARVAVAEPNLAVEVYQPGSAVLAHVPSTNALEFIDDRFLNRRATIALPEGANIQPFDTGLVVVGTNPAGLWRISTPALYGLEAITDISPLYEGTVEVVGVSHDGAVVFAPDGTGEIHVFGELPEPTVFENPFGGADEFVHEGTTPVVRTGERWAILDGDRFVEFASDVVPWEVSAQPSAGSDGLLLGMWAGGQVGRLDNDNGELRILEQLPGENFVAPISHDGCIFALSNVPASLWVGCGDEFTEHALGLPAGADLRLRLVNGWIWVNDVQSGHGAFYDNDLGIREIDDWSAVLPDEADPDEQVTESSESAIEEQVENPDAENALLVGADEFDDDGVNERPVAIDDVGEAGFQTHVERPVVATVLQNDTDPDNDVLLIESITNLSDEDAVIAITPDANAVHVTPAAGFEGTIRFRYTVSDGRGLDASAVASVVVSERSGSNNRAPVPRTDVGSITAGEKLVINVLENDIDPDGDSLVLVDAQAESGSITFDPSGQIIYEPEDTSEEGEIKLTYTVVDDFGEEAEGIVRALIRLKDSNRKPDARNDGAVTVVGQAVTINLLVNDTDADGDELYVSEQPVLFDAPSVDPFYTHSADGEFVFIPEVAGTYLFSYAAFDGEDADTALIRIEVAELLGNRSPVAVRDDVVVPIGQSRVVYVLANDGDPDGDVVGIVDLQVPSNSGIRVEDFQGIGYRVFVDDDGPTRRTFQYSISDGKSEPVSTTVVVAVSGADGENQPPFAQPDVVEVRAGASVTYPVLENDFDPEGGALQVVSVSDPDGGTAEIAANNQAVRVSVPATTTTSFDVVYQVVDDQGNGDASVLRVQLVPPGDQNRAPIARPDAARADFESEITIDALANDSDPDGDAIQVEAIVDQPENGLARIDPVSRELFYVPAAGFAGTDRFTYSVVDAFGLSAQGEILVGVLPEEEPNRDPIAVDDALATVATGQRLDLNVLQNDSDPDGDQLRIVSVEEPAFGTVERNLQRTALVYTAPAQLDRDEKFTFEYTISDGAGGRATASINALVEATPKREDGAPIAVDDSVGPYATGERVSVDVIANDSDPDAPTSELSVLVFDDELSVTGQFVVFDAPDESSEFDYEIVDADGNASTALILVEVFDPVPPIAVDDERGPVRAGETVDVSVLDNDLDPDGTTEGLRVIGVSGPVGASHDDSRVRIVAPFESTQYKYTIVDPDGQQASATISLIVTDNQAPIVERLQVSTGFEEPVEIDVTPQVRDPDEGDILLFTCCQSARDGQPEVLIDGEDRLVVLFRPDQGFSGDAAFSYQVDDQNGHRVAGTVTVRVEAQPNRPPTAQSSTTEVQLPRPGGPPITTEVNLESLSGDPDGDELTWDIVSGPDRGATAQIIGSKLIVQVDTSANAGDTSIGWVAVDPGGEQAPATLSVTITEPDNQPPTASDSEQDVSAGSSANVDLAALSSDPDEAGGNETLTYTIETLAMDGVTATLTGDSTVALNAVINGAGRTGQFAYTVTDRLGASATGSIRVVVGEPDAPPPQAVDDDDKTLQGQSVRIAVLTNDSDPLGQGLQVLNAGTTPDGTATANGAVVTFDPNPSFFGSTTFSYTMRDAAERESTANVTVEVTGVPDAPGPPVCAPESRIANLTWTTPSNNGAAITNYSLEHNQGGAIELPASNGYPWKDLTNGTAYEFRVRAQNEAGWGEFSGWSTSCVPDIEPEQPAPPQVTHGDRVLNVAWTAPTNDGSAIDLYEVQIGGGNPKEVNGSTTSLPWDNLTNGEAHTFRVRARNLAGWSPWSTPSEPEFASTTPKAPVIGGTTRGGLLGAAASGVLEVNWGAVRFPDNGGAPIQQYEVQLVAAGTPVPVIGENASSYLWSGLPNGVSHEFQVRAVNRDGVGPWSAASAPTQACTVPEVARAVNATGDNGYAVVTFDAPASDGGCSISKYNLRVAGAGDAGSDRGAPGSHRVEGLTNGNVYAFEVRAVNELGAGPWVQSNSVVPAGPPICAGGLTVVRRTHDRVSLSWSAADFNGADARGYDVRVNNGAWNFTSNDTSGEVADLAENSTYRIDVRAVNALAPSDVCGTQSGITTCGKPPQPGTPTLSANQDNNSITGTWTTVGNLNDCDNAYDVTRYEVELEGRSATSVGVSTSNVWNDQTPGDYRLRVRACNTLGCGSWSSYSATRTIDADAVCPEDENPGSPAAIFENFFDVHENAGPLSEIHFHSCAGSVDSGDGRYWVQAVLASNEDVVDSVSCDVTSPCNSVLNTGGAGRVNLRVRKMTRDGGFITLPWIQARHVADDGTEYWDTYG